MTAILLTVVLLGLMVLRFRGWLRYSPLVTGLAIGAVLAFFAGPSAMALAAAPHIPVWLPALPFALVAVSLFVFGLVAWFQAEA